MDILVLTREFPPYILGGISYHLQNLYNEIAARGHNIEILSGKCPQAWTDEKHNISSNITVRTVEFGYRKGYYVLYPLALWRKLKKVDIDEFDVVITHTPLPYDVGDTPLITKYHDCIAETREYTRQNRGLVEKMGDSFLHPFRQHINKKSIQITDFAIYNSKLNRRGWVENYGKVESNSVIYNGVDTELFYPDKGSSDNEYVLFVGTTGKKGIKRVIKYADKGQYTVHIVGDIDIEHPNIVSHGRVAQEKLRKVYSNAIATIHPAQFESFGNVVLESLACGTPVVTTPECGASEILNDRVGKITYDIIDGVDSVQGMNQKACRSVATYHCWGRVAKETISVFQETLR